MPAGSESEPEKRKWYQSKKTLIIALLTLGPFALLLLWFNPRYSIRSKVTWTILLVAFTYGLGVLSAWLIRILMAQLGVMESGY